MGGSFPNLDLTFACAGEADEVGSIIHEGSQSEYLSILSLSALDSIAVSVFVIILVDFDQCQSEYLSILSLSFQLPTFTGREVMMSESCYVMPASFFSCDKDADDFFSLPFVFLSFFR